MEIRDKRRRARDDENSGDLPEVHRQQRDSWRKRHHICDRGVDLQRRHATDSLSSRVHFLPWRNGVIISKTARLLGLRNPVIDLHSITAIRPRLFIRDASIQDNFFSSPYKREIVRDENDVFMKNLVVLLVTFYPVCSSYLPVLLPPTFLLSDSISLFLSSLPFFRLSPLQAGIQSRLSRFIRRSPSASFSVKPRSSSCSLLVIRFEHP